MVQLAISFTRKGKGERLKRISRHVAPLGEQQPALVRRVLKEVDQENAPTQRALAQKLNVCAQTVNNIIHKNLGLKTLMKPKVHDMDDLHKTKRHIRAARLLRGPLKADCMEFVVTLDEAWLSLSDTDCVSPHCYVPKHSSVPSGYVRKKGMRWGKKMMVVAIMTGRGNLPLIKVPPQTKFNAAFYIDYVLIPLITEWLPQLYPEGLERVFIHHDGATSHTADLTKKEMDNLKMYFGFNIIKKEDIPPKAPDASPLDFFGFGYLKQALRTAQCTTLCIVREGEQSVVHYRCTDHHQSVR